jgi:hypothetical protein
MNKSTVDGILPNAHTTLADMVSKRDADLVLHQAFTPAEFELMRLLGMGNRGQGHDKKVMICAI